MAVDKVNKGTSSTSREMKTWASGKIISGHNVVSTFNFTLHYATPCVWEGIRSYKQADGTTKIWALKEHIDRFIDSAKIIGFEIPNTKEELIKACSDLVDINGGGDLYLRPIAYAKGDAEAILSKADRKIAVDIYCCPIPEPHGKKEGIKVIISAHRRGYPDYQMQAKTSANYVFLERCKAEIERTGADDALLTDNQGYIVEAQVANLFVFRGDVVFTPPNTGSILPGITRECVARTLMRPELFLQTGRLPMLVEKNITRSDVYTADCIILVGTYAEIVNVLEVDGRKIGNADSHFYYKMIKGAYSQLVRGGLVSQNNEKPKPGIAHKKRGNP
jgi:branched-chain amino acid aminotransferase